MIQGFWDLDYARIQVHLLSTFFSVRYQDVHNQSYIMVIASGRWLGVRLHLLAAMLIGAVSLAAAFVSQEAGRCIYLPS